MTIPIPTIDDFDTSTVMTTVREVVDYIIDLVPDINKGDIGDLKTTYENNVLTIKLIKYGGSQISRQVTIPGGSGTESPYPTDVALSLSGTVLNCDITLSNNTHVSGSVDLADYVSSIDYTIKTVRRGGDYANGYVIKSGNVESDIVVGFEISTGDDITQTENYLFNNLYINKASTGELIDSAMYIPIPIVKSVSGSVSDGKLKIVVNGVSSGDIPLPDSGYEQYLIYNGTSSYLFGLPVSAIDRITTKSINTKSSFVTKYVANNFISTHDMFFSVVEEGDVHNSDRCLTVNKKYSINRELFDNYIIIENGNTVDITEIESIKLENVYIYKSNTIIDLDIEVIDATHFNISSNVDCYMYVNSNSFQIRPTDATKFSFVRKT